MRFYNLFSNVIKKNNKIIISLKLFYNKIIKGIIYYNALMEFLYYKALLKFYKCYLFVKNKITTLFQVIIIFLQSIFLPFLPFIYKIYIFFKNLYMYLFVKISQFIKIIFGKIKYYFNKSVCYLKNINPLIFSIITFLEIILILLDILFVDILFNYYIKNKKQLNKIIIISFYFLTIIISFFYFNFFEKLIFNNLDYLSVLNFFENFDNSTLSLEDQNFVKEYDKKFNFEESILDDDDELKEEENIWTEYFKDEDFRKRYLIFLKHFEDDYHFDDSYLVLKEEDQLNTNLNESNTNNIGIVLYKYLFYSILVFFLIIFKNYILLPITYFCVFKEIKIYILIYNFLFFFDFLNKKLEFFWKYLKWKRFGLDLTDINKNFQVYNEDKNFLNSNYALMSKDPFKNNHYDVYKNVYISDDIIKDIYDKYEKPKHFNIKEFNSLFELNDKEKQKIIVMFKNNYNLLESPYFSKFYVYDKTYIIQKKSISFNKLIEKNEKLIQYYQNKINNNLLGDYGKLLNNYLNINLKNLNQKNTYNIITDFEKKTYNYSLGCGKDPYILFNNKLIKKYGLNKNIIKTYHENYNNYIKNSTTTIDPNNIIIESDISDRNVFLVKGVAIKQLLINRVPKHKLNLLHKYYNSRDIYDKFLDNNIQINELSFFEYIYHIWVMGNFSDFILIFYNIVFFLYLIIIIFFMFFFFNRYYLYLLTYKLKQITILDFIDILKLIKKTFRIILWLIKNSIKAVKFIINFFFSKFNNFIENENKKEKKYEEFLKKKR